MSYATRTKVGFGVLAVVAIAAVGQSMREPPPPLPTPVAPWWPDDFTLSTDPNVAVRFMDQREFDCTYSGSRCLGMLVVSRDGCPTSLYVELTLLDSDATAIGYTNDSLGALRAGERGRLIFDVFDDDAADGRIADVSCY